MKIAKDIHSIFFELISREKQDGIGFEQLLEKEWVATRVASRSKLIIKMKVMI